VTKYGFFKRIIHWLLIIVVVLYLISGFGITEFRDSLPDPIGVARLLLIGETTCESETEIDNTVT